MSTENDNNVEVTPDETEPGNDLQLGNPGSFTGRLVVDSDQDLAEAQSVIREAKADEKPIVFYDSSTEEHKHQPYEHWGLLVNEETGGREMTKISTCSLCGVSLGRAGV